MSGDGFPFALPASRFAAVNQEATTLFEQLRKPLLRYLICLGLSADEAQDVVQDAFLNLHRSLAGGVLEMLDESTPEHAVLKKEKFRQLSSAIRTLTEAERECLLLRAEGLRYREIGEVLEMATSTVADTVDRAVKKLAEKCNV
jgi:RNA polymerase sigma-70 factor (ECF subfamily)